MTSTSASTAKPRSVADALGLGTLADDEPGMDPELLRRIYRHARGEDGQRKLFENHNTFVKGWVDLSSQRAQELISAFVALDEAENLKHARHIAENNLEAQPWNDILGIDDPPIVCEVKQHGMVWGLRFRSGVGTRRGAETINEQLPTIPGSDVQRPCPAAEVGDAVLPTSVPPLVAAESLEARANDALRAAGMPA